ncbi:P-loop containing nucleoside triphosphate hydrolase [Freshwater phage uvFW-CGR-AMD-COM-C203]|nr:P-loop containing nucleoside triphosphate hydrolase [Freshwater phage uvFW-CGR-AMD-COM-C203]
MTSQIHFLAGLPRSGNTVLSALLNQNPDIYSSPLSYLAELYWNITKDIHNDDELIRNEQNHTRLNDLLTTIPNVFYQDVKKPIIIDRNKAWGTPYNLNVIKNYITPNPKIICTVRDVLEILASYLTINYENVKRETFETQNFFNDYYTEVDCMAEHLMDSNGGIAKTMLSLASAFYPENKGMFHFVEYNDLVNKPQETMNKVYGFLELPSYKHNFNKIKKLEIDNDIDLGISFDMHKVRPKISPSTTSLDILSPFIKAKYANMEFWREDSLLEIKGKNF